MSKIKPVQDSQLSDPQKKTFDSVKSAMGFVPNLFRVFANSPVAVDAYLTLDGLLDKSSLDADDKQVVILTVSEYNRCGYCMAAHSAGSGLPDGMLDALRNGKPIESSEKLEALRQFTRKVVDQRGWLEDSDVDAFLDAGYSQAQLLDVLVAVAMKMLSNYTNHIADTPLDKPLESVAWSKESGPAVT